MEFESFKDIKWITTTKVNTTIKRAQRETEYFFTYFIPKLNIPKLLGTAIIHHPASMDGSNYTDSSRWLLSTTIYKMRGLRRRYTTSAVP